MPEYPGPQVFHTAKGIYNFSGEHILHQGVDGEISAAGSGGGADKGIHEDLKILMTVTSGFFFSGHGDVQRETFQTENAETFADGHPLAQAVQNVFQCLGRDTVNFDVNILVFLVEQSIPDITAHIVGAATLLGYQLGDFLGHVLIFPMLHGITSFVSLVLS